MTTIFHYMIYLECCNYTGEGETIDYMEEPIDNTGCIHFVRYPNSMDNRHEDLLLLGVF